VVTAGPFAAKTVVPGARVVLKRNPHYWKRDGMGVPLPYLDEMLIEVVSEANQAFARLTQGSLDLYDKIRPADYVSLSKEPGAIEAADLGPGLGTDYLWFNLNPAQRGGKPVVSPIKRAWFNDLRFRRAISHTIDREAIASVTLQGLATPLYSFVSPGNREWVAPDLVRASYNLEEARALLLEAGFTLRGEKDRPELYDAAGNRVELTMIVPAESQSRVQMATVVQEDWARIGIKATVAPIEFGQLSLRISQSYDYDAALLGANVSEPDPSAYTNLLISSSSSRPWSPRQPRPAAGWESRLDQLLGAQAREADRERRRIIFREIQALLSEQLPVIPLVARHVICAATQRTGNYRPSVLQPYALWNAEELFVR
jgi:peptide/nickel transport system substrate-binding protein